MDFTNTILGVVLFSFIIGPIYIINKNVKKKKSQALKALNELSVDKNEAFLEADFWNNDFGIGLKTNELCFIGKQEDSVIKDVIRMKEIKRCTIVKTGKSGHPKENHDIVKLSLHLEFKTQKHMDLVLFETSPSHFIIGEEVRIANKWEKLISSKI